MPTLDLNVNGLSQSRILDHRGQPMNNPRPPGAGLAIGHAQQFAATLGAFRTYMSDRWDEALRRGREESNSMRRDAFLSGLLNERSLSVATLRWHIEVDNDRDPQQKAIKDGLTAIVKNTAYLQQLFYCLQDETVWTGKGGHQIAWHWKTQQLPSPKVRAFGTGMGGAPGAVPGQPAAPPVPGASPLPGGDPNKSTPEARRTLAIKLWQPISGDSITHEHDGTPVMLVNQATLGTLKNERIVQTTLGRGLALQGTWRTRFILDRHIPVAAEFFDFERAEAIHGVGLRSLVYWTNFMRLEGLENVLSWCTRTGLGIRLWYYQGGNKQSKEEVSRAAADQNDKVNLLIPRFGDKAVEGVDVVDGGTAGADLLLRVQEFFLQGIERLIIGQSMSGGSGSGDPLGGEGKSKLAESTKSKIIQFDANCRADTITQDWVKPVLRWTYPDFFDLPVRFVYDVDEQEPEQFMASVKAFIEVGGTVREDDVRGKLSLKEPLDGDKVLGGQQQGPGGMPGMPGQPPTGDDGTSPGPGGSGPDAGPQPPNNHPLPPAGGAAHKSHYTADVGGHAAAGKYERRGTPDRYAQVHAPHNMTIAGTEYRGGQFIPSAELAKMAPADKQALLAKEHVRAADEGDILAHDTGGGKLTMAGDKKFTNKVNKYFAGHVKVIGETFAAAVVGDDPESARDLADEDLTAVAEHYQSAIASHMKAKFPDTAAAAGKGFAAAVDAALGAAVETIYAAAESEDPEGVEDAVGEMYDAFQEAAEKFDDECQAAMDDAEAADERNTAAVEKYFDDITDDAETAVGELKNPTEADVARVWAGIIRDYNETLSTAENPLRVTLGDDGELEAVHVVDLPEEHGGKAKKEKAKYRRKGKVNRFEKPPLLERIATAADTTHTTPTDAQRAAGNYRKGVVRIHGLPIAIETPAGTSRKPEWPPLAHHYGYIKRTESEADGDAIDVFIGPDPESELVFVVDQVKESGAFDEHKVLIGFTKAKDARAGYLANYADGWKMGPMKALTVDAFKEWLETGDTGKPVYKQKLRYAKAGDHDVTGEPRDTDGKWTTGGNSGKSKGQPDSPSGEKSLTDMTASDVLMGKTSWAKWNDALMNAAYDDDGKPIDQDKVKQLAANAKLLKQFLSNQQIAGREVMTDKGPGKVVGFTRDITHALVEHADGSKTEHWADGVDSLSGHIKSELSKGKHAHLNKAAVDYFANVVAKEIVSSERNISEVLKEKGIDALKAMQIRGAIAEAVDKLKEEKNKPSPERQQAMDKAKALQDKEELPSEQPDEVSEPRGEIVDAIKQAKETDRQFKGEGRYEAEVWIKFRAKYPGEPMPKLSKAGAEYVRDEMEADGKPVPPEVLADYPDLVPKEAGKYAKQPDAAHATPTLSISTLIHRARILGPAHPQGRALCAELSAMLVAHPDLRRMLPAGDLAFVQAMEHGGRDGHGDYQKEGEQGSMDDQETPAA